MAPLASRPYIGGQAVLEGVMMRAPSSFAVVIRKGDGSLRVRERAMTETRRGAARWPFVRGVTSVVESLRLGSEALRFSAEELEGEGPGQGGGSGPSSSGPANGLGVLGAFGLALHALATVEGDGPAALSARKGESRGSWLMLAVAIVFLIALPQGAAALVSRIFGLDLPVHGAAFQALTGAFKLVVVVGYLLAIRRVPEIRRVFQYHGAEHKAISTYEAGEPLEVPAARAKTTLHPRCGTTFLVMVALVSIGVFTVVGAALPRVTGGGAVLDNVVFFFEKLPFVPALAAVTFELQRLLARYASRGPLRALLWPGFLVQKITTAEPDDAQLEVALASLRVTLFREAGRAGASAGEREGDVVFATFSDLLAAERLRRAA